MLKRLDAPSASRPGRLGSERADRWSHDRGPRVVAIGALVAFVLAFWGLLVYAFLGLFF